VWRRNWPRTPSSRRDAYSWSSWRRRISGKPAARPTLRWLFQVFEGIDLHHTLHLGGTRATDVLRLTKVHRLVLRLLGPAYEICYLTFQEAAE
jgi:hypothetical protein